MTVYNTFSFKKPWLFGEYEKVQTTVDEAEVYLGQGITTTESQFKKPYDKQDHPDSENFFSGPGASIPRQLPWGLPGNDCKPSGTGIGGGALNPCVPQLSCGQWAWNCAHRITKYKVVGNGYIQSIQYGKEDTVIVTVCWDENNMGGQTFKGTLVGTADGAIFVSKVPLNCLGPGHDNTCTSCLNCQGAGHTPDILYVTKQMSISGTQNLTVSGGGGGPYKWSIKPANSLCMGGAGSLSLSTTNAGQITLYTAPSANANCYCNPTITVTDYCGNKATLKLAVNGDTAGQPAYAITTYEGTHCSLNTTMVIRPYLYGCTGGVGTPGAIACTICSNGLGCPPGSCVVNSTGCLDMCLPSPPPGDCGPACPQGCNEGALGDIRSSTQKNAGCCPAALL